MIENVVQQYLFLISAKPELTIDTGKHIETKFMRLGDSEKLTCPFRHFDHVDWFKDTKPFSKTTDIEFRNISVSDHQGNS